MTNIFANRIQQIPTSFIREILQYANQPGVISFAGGIPEENLFPVKEIQESTQRVLMNQSTNALQYGPTEGSLALREQIVQRYKTKGVQLTADNILITSGSQQGLDLIAKLFLEKDRHVIVEAPTYLGALQCFSQYECKFDEVPLLPDGPDTDELKYLLWASHKQVAFMYMIPDFQNPTGVQYSLERRKALGNIMQYYAKWMIEDAPYVELNYGDEQLPSMLELFPENTIQLGSFSKVWAPGMRLGWIAAPTIIIQQLKLLKQASDLHSSSFVQEIMLDVLQNGGIDDHINKIREVYGERRNAMVEALQECSDFLDFESPNGGMFCWAEMKEGNAEAFNRMCIEKKVVFVPGAHFYAKEKNPRTLRLNFSKNNPDMIWKGVEGLRSVWESKYAQRTPEMMGRWFL
ncbi:MAG: PLP-dependent aminotransferase family protein [Cytophagaceae bacterium]